MTVGATTAVIREHFDGWAARVGPEIVGDWIFAPDYRRAVYTRASRLSHRFVRLRDRAAVPDAALHRFRHAVATALVEDGKFLKAQARLGHRDAATTLRHYAHATPLDDLDIPTTSTGASTRRPGEPRTPSKGSGRQVALARGSTRESPTVSGATEPAVGMIAVAGFPKLGSAFAASSLGVAELGTGQLARIVERGSSPPLRT